jgi:hypothetical protein
VAVSFIDGRTQNNMCGVMASLLATSAVYCGFKRRSGQTNNYVIVDKLYHKRDQPFNLQGGLWFLFRSEIYFRTTRELEGLFFQFFNFFDIRLFDKNSELDFFSSSKIRPRYN